MNGCQNNLENLSATKVGKHITSAFSMSIISSFKEKNKHDTQNKHDICRGKGCIKKFCECLEKHTKTIMNFKKKKTKLLINEQQESYKKAKLCFIFGEKYANYKKYHKVRHHCHYAGAYRGAVHSICNWKYSIPKEITVIFHNGSNYYYHFIIKELANAFEWKFTCSGENTEKYISFSVPIEKEVKRISKKDEEITKTISWKLKLINSARFMACSLSNLVNNLAEGIQKIKRKYGNDNKKCKTCGIKCKDCECCLGYTNGNLIVYQCLWYNKNCQKNLHENLKKRFANIYKFSNHDINKFILLLRKGVCSYGYMDDWENFSKT